MNPTLVNTAMLLLVNDAYTRSIAALCIFTL
jgi:hypothetical protein